MPLGTESEAKIVCTLMWHSVCPYPILLGICSFLNVSFHAFRTTGHF